MKFVIKRQKKSLKMLQRTQPTTSYSGEARCKHGVRGSSSKQVFLLGTNLMPRHPGPPVENVWWLDLNFLSRRHVQQMHNYYAKKCNYLISICCSISCVALPSSSQQHSRTIEASVASGWSSKLPSWFQSSTLSYNSCRNSSLKQAQKPPEFKSWTRPGLKLLCQIFIRHSSCRYCITVILWPRLLTCLLGKAPRQLFYSSF